MPYRVFADLGIYARADSSAAFKARSTSIARQWINRHGKYKSIALLQVLIEYPYLFSEFFDPEQDYGSTMKQLSKDCLELIGDDIIEIHESAVDIRQSTSSDDFVEMIDKLEQLNMKISASNITNLKKRTLSINLNNVGKKLDAVVDSIVAIVSDSQEMLDRSVDHLIDCRFARDLVEEALAQQISDQWYTNVKE